MFLPFQFLLAILYYFTSCWLLPFSHICLSSNAIARSSCRCSSLKKKKNPQTLHHYLLLAIPALTAYPPDLLYTKHLPSSSFRGLQILHHDPRPSIRDASSNIAQCACIHLQTETKNSQNSIYSYYLQCILMFFIPGFFFFFKFYQREREYAPA